MPIKIAPLLFGASLIALASVQPAAAQFEHPRRAGDMGRGQSLIVWAIAEGRSAAATAKIACTARRATT